MCSLFFYRIWTLTQQSAYLAEFVAACSNEFESFFHGNRIFVKDTSRGVSVRPPKRGCMERSATSYLFRSARLCTVTFQNIIPSFFHNCNDYMDGLQVKKPYKINIICKVIIA